jgi:hypothetical protein
MKRFIFFVFAGLFAHIAFAAGTTFETGKDGLVIKEASCYSGGTWVKGIAVNRTAQTISGGIEVSVLDSDGDFLWRGLTKIDVGPQNGQNLDVKLGAGNCNGKRIAFRFLD